MEEVFKEIKIKARLSEAVDYFYNTYKESPKCKSINQQFTVDFINLMNCTSIEEIDEYVDINKKNIYVNFKVYE